MAAFAGALLPVVGELTLPEFVLLLLGTATVTVLVVVAYSVGAYRRIDFLREAAIVIGAYFAYFLVRGATEGDVGEALKHANAIEAFERSKGIYIELALQAAILGERWIVDAMNWIYLWGHWPVIGVTAAWLYMKRPRSFQLYRNAFLISGAIRLFSSRRSRRRRRAWPSLPSSTPLPSTPTSTGCCSRASSRTSTPRSQACTSAGTY